MKRVGFMLKVRADRKDEYREHHRAVWPDMLDALRRTGWHNYSIFMAGDGTLFGYVEVEDSFAAALAAMDREEANERWQNYMADFFEIPPGSLSGGQVMHADQAMVELEEVFHLD